jgi:rhodanese-related sulfurtransferase
MRHAIPLLAVVLVALAPLRAGAACHEDLSVTDADERISAGEAVVIDVRTPREFGGPLGHIEGALLLPLGQLEEALHHLSDVRGRTLIVVCRSGNRSTTASRILCEAGFANVMNLSGGMKAWQRAGLPAVHE